MRLLAYVDPGTGSMVIQVIFGALLGALVVLRTFFRKTWDKFKSALTSRKKTVDEEPR